MAINGCVTASYGSDRYWKSRTEAIKWYEKAALYSSDDELAGYKRILRSLKNGMRYATDNDMLSLLEPYEHYCSNCNTAVLSPSWSKTCCRCGKKFCLSEVFKREV